MTNILRRLVENTPIPRMVKIRQSFDATILENPIGELINQLRLSPQMAQITAVQKVAVAVGSRGISR